MTKYTRNIVEKTVDEISTAIVTTVEEVIKVLDTPINSLQNNSKNKGK